VQLCVNGINGHVYGRNHQTVVSSSALSNTNLFHYNASTAVCVSYSLLG